MTRQATRLSMERHSTPHQATLQQDLTRHNMPLQAMAFHSSARQAKPRHNHVTAHCSARHTKLGPMAQLSTALHITASHATTPQHAKATIFMPCHTDVTLQSHTMPLREQHNTPWHGQAIERHSTLRNSTSQHVTPSYATPHPNLPQHATQRHNYANSRYAKAPYSTTTARYAKTRHAKTQHNHATTRYAKPLHDTPSYATPWHSNITARYTKSRCAKPQACRHTIRQANAIHSTARQSTARHFRPRNGTSQHATSS